MLVSFATWNLLFTGMVGSILLLNVVQWGIYRERIYGFYTLYMLAWLVYFGFRIPAIQDFVSPNAWYYVRAVFPMLAYFIYFDFANQLIKLHERLPRLLRIFRLTQALILLYGIAMGALCYELINWKVSLYDGIHTAMRVLMIGMSVYGIYQIGRLKGLVPRYVALGSTFLLVGGIVSMVMTSLGLIPDEPSWFTRAPLTYFMFGIMAELICFTLVLGYRQRRAFIRAAIVEQKLAREREQHQREQVEAELNSEKLRQQMSAVQMMALQSQLNPHFLFNSLNSLSSLIADEPERAERFVDEMSSVYRYLLRTNDYELTTLQNELTFIDSYYHLLETRHGSGIQLIKRIEDQYLTYSLPPLTLQVLLENAVKHNEISPKAPLCIYLETTSTGWFSVRNTLQRKAVSRVNSTQKGLLNIIAKYQLLEQEVPTVHEVDGFFTVSFPLIDPTD